MTTPNYDINYDDKRFTQVNTEKDAALSEIEKTYGGMISDSDKFYQAQIDASKNWADTQTKLQNEKTEFAIDQIEQQKANAQKDYTKEQSGAYVDYQKQSNAFGANAEQMAAQGMANTGFSESAQVSMYNTYQSRVVAAREAFVRSKQNFDNMMTEARLQNNSALAEIALEAHKEQLKYALEGFQYKNTLILEKANKKTEIGQIYHDRYQDVLDQINKENALAENVRQYNESLAESKRHNQAVEAAQAAQLAEEKRQFNEQMAYTKSKDAASGSSGGSGGSGSSGGKINKTSAKKTASSAAIAGVKAASSKAAEKAKASSKQTIDMDSVLDLGFGPISASRLAELEKQGIVTHYVSGNKIKFRLSASSVKQKMLLNGMERIK